MTGSIPNPDSPPGQLAQALRELYRAAGFESLRKLAKSAHCGTTTAHDALSGKPNKVPSPDVIKAIWKACKADEPTLTRLLDMREKALADRDNPPGPPPPLTPESMSSVNPVPVARPWYRRRGRLTAAAAVGLASLIALIVVAIVSSDESCRGPGVMRSGQFNECVGVTDGAATFAPELGLQTVLGDPVG